MPTLQAQSQALQNGLHAQAGLQPTSMPAGTQATQGAQATGQQPPHVQANASAAQAQPQAQPPTQQQQVSGQQQLPQLQQPFSFLSLLQQPSSAAIPRGLLDQLSSPSPGQQLSGLSLPTASGQMQQIPNVAAGLMQLLQQQASARQPPVAQKPTLPASDPLNNVQ